MNNEFHCDNPSWDPELSLVPRAAGLLQQVTGCTKGVTVQLNKRIPLLSGLGGDSSDAAAMLHGLNRLWELGLSSQKLLALAASLGSDVGFFLYGGTALLQGRGEIITPLPPLPMTGLVLAMPPAPGTPGKTGALYAQLRSSHYTDGHITQIMAEEITAGRQLEPSLLFNTFENIAFTRLSELSICREHILKMGGGNVHLSGTGPALFTLIDDREAAASLCRLIAQQGMQSWLTTTLAAPDNQDTATGM